METAGSHFSQMPKIRIRKMPVTNSGVAVKPRLVIEIARSSASPFVDAGQDAQDQRQSA